MAYGLLTDPGSAGAISPMEATSSPASAVLRSTVIEDAGTQATLQPWIPLDCYQLSRGRRVGQMQTIDLGSHRMVRERQDAAVHKIGKTPANLCTVSYCSPAACSPAASFRFSDHGAAGDTAVYLLPENTEFDIHVPAGAETVYVSFPQDEFLRDVQTLNPDLWNAPPGSLTRLAAAPLTSFAAVAAQWFGAVAEAAGRGDSLPADAVRRSVSQAVSLIVGGAEVAAIDPPAAARSLRICRTVRDFVEASLGEDELPTVVDLCRTAGVSERTLQYAFRRYVGLSPLAYLRLCRLNRARAVLLASDPQAATVTAVAMQVGFTHFGRFAHDYKCVFDESPSTTLARSGIAWTRRMVPTGDQLFAEIG